MTEREKKQASKQAWRISHKCSMLILSGLEDRYHSLRAFAQQARENLVLRKGHFFQNEAHFRLGHLYNHPTYCISNLR